MPNYPLWVPVRDSVATVQSSGSLTGPTAGTTVTSVTIPVPGIWEIWVHVYLGGSGPTATDSTNMQLVKTSGAATTVVLSPINVPPQANGATEDIVVTVIATTNDTVSVKAIANATGTAIYNVMLVARIVNGNAP